MAKSCAICKRELKVVDDLPRYVTSGFTKNSYCLPGEGCWVDARIKETWEDEEPLDDSQVYEPPLSGINNQASRSAENTEATSVPVPAT